MNKETDPALLYAAQKGHLDCLNELLEAGSDVNAKDKEGNTALIKAVIFCNGAVVDLLLANGAEINTENKKGETALYLAVKHGHAEYESEEPNEEKRIAVGESTGFTASTKIVQTLLQVGAHLNDTSSGLNPASAHLKPTQLKKPNVHILKMLMVAGGDSSQASEEFIPEKYSLQNLVRNCIREHLSQFIQKQTSILPLQNWVFLQGCKLIYCFTIGRRMIRF